MIHYHDREWGVPVHDENRLFEFLLLEGAQAGLSWMTILKRRENYRRAFKDYDLRAIARFSEARKKQLLSDKGIIRNRLKIESAVTNAQSFLRVQEEFGSFDKYIWGFVNETSIQNRWKSLRELPAKTRESENMSKDLKKRGFRFVGPTICYAFMQAVGMVNDHRIDCFRHAELSARR